MRSTPLMRLVCSLLLSILLVLLLSSCHSLLNGGGGQITGAGASLPQPFYQLAFRHFYDSTGVSVNYGALGSGGGIRSLRDRVTDFGATDAFLSSRELTSFDDSVLHIPTCMAAVVLAYNLEGITRLNLSAELLALIYLGEITRWNDPRLKALNPGIPLPNLPIIPVYRSDGSGTTLVFSHYMTSASPLWASSMGVGKALQWKCGVASKGNPGVAGIISQTPGAIGYLGSEYAFAMQLRCASIQNACGNFILPEIETITAAGEQEIPEDTRAMIIDAPAENAYPISCFTWIILYRDQSYADRTLEQAVNTYRLMDFLLGEESQALAEKVYYVRLPAPVAEKARRRCALLSYKGRYIHQLSDSLSNSTLSAP